MGAKTPPAPDPVKTATAQGAVNRDTAITQYLLNATDQVTPFGSLTYEPIGNWADNPMLNPAARSSSQLPAASTPTQSATTRGTSYTGPDFGTSKSAMNGGPTNSSMLPMANGGAASSTASNVGAADMLGNGYLNTPRFRAVQTLAPDLQTTVNNYLGTAANLSGTVASTLGQQFDASGLPARAGNLSAPSLANVPINASWNGPQARYTIDNAGAIQKDIGPDDFSADRQRVEEALLSRINSSYERDRSTLEANLRARGIGVGTNAYDRAMDEINRTNTDKRFAAILAGGDEQSRLSGLELAQGNFRNAAQAQQYGQNANDAAFFNSAQQQNFGQSMALDQFARDGIGINNQTSNLGFNQSLAAAQFNNTNRSGALEEAAYLRSLPLNEINALLQGTQLAGPKFTNTPQPGVQGVDYAGLVNDQYKAQVQAAQQKNANLFGGIASIGGSLASLFSDRRLKTAIEPIRATLGGFQLYSYRYLGSDDLSFGVMADEVAETMPEAVVERDGFLAVRYDMLEAA